MKKHSFKKVLALLIAIIMVIPAIPVVASAAETTYTYQTATPTDTTYVDNLAGWVEQAKDPSDSTGQTLLIKDKDDLIYFMIMGQDTDPNTTAGTAGKIGNTDIDIRMTDYKIKLTNNIVWNEGTATADGFVPASGTTIDTWSPWYSAHKSNSNYNGGQVSRYWGFRGTFDGNGYKISGLVIENSGETNACAYNGATGFFRRVGDGAVIQNVEFDNMYVAGKNYVGAVIGTSRGSFTVDNVIVNGHVKGEISVGGIISCSDVEQDRTWTIKNTTVSGTVSASKYVVGGFIGATSGYTVNISNSICYAEVTAGSNPYFEGGFIGAAESNITFSNCQHFGNQFDNSRSGAFVRIHDITTTTKPEENSVDISTNTTSTKEYTITLNDCYRNNLSTYPIGFASNAGYARYDIVTQYGTEEAKTVDLATALGEGETFSFQTVKKSYANMKQLVIDEGTTDLVSLYGVQMGTNNNARFVSSITTEEGIRNIGYEAIELNALAAKNEAITANCGYAFASLKDNFGLGALVAGEGDLADAQYLTALAICGVNADVPTTILVRNVVELTTTDAKTGEYNVVYSGYMAVTFCNGKVAGLAYVVVNP